MLPQNELVARVALALETSEHDRMSGVPGAKLVTGWSHKLAQAAVEALPESDRELDPRIVALIAYGEGTAHIQDCLWSGHRGGKVGMQSARQFDVSSRCLRCLADAAHEARTALCLPKQ